jgi:hypothetical protein
MVSMFVELNNSIKKQFTEKSKDLETDLVRSSASKPYIKTGNAVTFFNDTFSAIV